MARSAHSEPEPACHVEERFDRSTLAPAWLTAVESLEVELASASGTVGAPCGVVALSLAKDPAGMRVIARSSDGRETARLVKVPAGLSPVAFGLIAVAPGDPVTTPVDPHEVPPPPDPVVVPAPPPPPPPPWSLSFDASSGVRAVFPTRVLINDYEVRADLLLHEWLATFEVRAAPVVLAMRGTYDEDAYDEAAVGLGLGRLFRVGRSVLAITGEANIAFIWLENDALNLAAERDQLRLAAVARWSYPIKHRFRLTAALDAEVSPTGLVNGSAGAGLAAFPAFTLGARLGAEFQL